MKFLLAIVAVLVCAAAPAQRNFGCAAQLGSRPENYFQLFNSTENIQLDNFVATEVTVLRNFFAVQPSFFFYNDSDGPNARAMSAVQVEAYPSGTVIFGLNFLSNEFNYSRSGTTIPLVMAHEFAHILDYEMGATKGYDTKTAELFADFQAGCFLFFRSYLTYTDVQAVLLNFYNKGDYEFNNPDHHGTPQERLDALLAGYNWLKSVCAPGVYIGRQQAVDAAKRYLGIPVDGNDSYGGVGNNSDVAGKISTVTRLLTPQTDGYITTYTYSVRVFNNNNFAVYATVGGLVYGYYKGCNSSAYNFEEEGEFEEELVAINAHSSEVIEFSVSMEEDGPAYCSGVKTGQQALVLDAEEQ